ncbi:hypothetical protein [Yersinia bercovieri]|uniref:hypothetical protein n=1 Tax=Yersinia bercovieri TaxID=634 RepID=UPI0021F5D656|nr:hypothetical protein [Yersinia bercovieri]
MLIFKNAVLKPVMEELREKGGNLLFVKDEGIYLMAEYGGFRDGCTLLMRTTSIPGYQKTNTGMKMLAWKSVTMTLASPWEGIFGEPLSIRFWTRVVTFLLT